MPFLISTDSTARLGAQCGIVIVHVPMDTNNAAKTLLMSQSLMLALQSHSKVQMEQVGRRTKYTPLATNANPLLSRSMILVSLQEGSA